MRLLGHLGGLGSAHSSVSPAIDRQRQRLYREELNPARRARLFASFGAPRAAVVRGLTDGVLRMLLAEGSGLNGARVLDYGCGVMPYAAAFSLAGAEVTGADIGENVCASVQLSDRGGIPASDCTFDVVTSFQVLEHVPSPQEYLLEAHRVLKPGGRMLLTTHGMWPFHPTPTDYRRWTRQGLECELEQSGFEVLSCTHILNEYSAALQFAVMAGDYRGAWGRARGLVHAVTHCAIVVLEAIGCHQPQTPAVLCLRAVKVPGAPRLHGGLA